MASNIEFNNPIFGEDKESRAQNYICAVPVNTWEEFQKITNEIDDFRFIYGQKEISVDNYEHYQILIGFKKRKTLTYLKKKLNNEAIRIESCGNVRRAAEYCTKEETRNGTIIAIGDVPVYIKSTQGSIWKEILLEKDADITLDKIKEHFPEKYIMQHAAISSYAESKRAQEINKRDVESFNEPLINVKDGLTHIFVGKTALGKTAYACAHFKNPVMISDRQDFKKIKRETDGMIIDDMSFNMWNPSNLLHLVDIEYDRTINVKYGSVNVPKDLPRIITINSLSNFWPENINHEQRAAISRRICIHKFYFKLFGDKFDKWIGERILVDYTYHQKCEICSYNSMDEILIYKDKDEVIIRNAKEVVIRVNDNESKMYTYIKNTSEHFYCNDCIKTFELKFN